MERCTLQVRMKDRPMCAHSHSPLFTEMMMTSPRGQGGQFLSIPQLSLPPATVTMCVPDPCPWCSWSDHIFSCPCPLCGSVPVPSETRLALTVVLTAQSDQDTIMAKVTGSTELPFLSEPALGKQGFYALVAEPSMSTWSLLSVVLKLLPRAWCRSNHIM